MTAIIAAILTIHSPAVFAQTGNVNPGINVIELRNYVLKPGQRGKFTSLFEQHFVQSQFDLGGYPLNWFKVDGAPDNFLWIRGFTDMASRSKFLPAFYHGTVWKQYKSDANSKLANNDNVYLLKPLTLSNGALETGKPVSSNLFKNNKGIAVVDYYIANTKLDKLKAAFAKYYLPAYKLAGIEKYTLWVSELEKNDFPQLPVFQDGNLLVTITFYKDEAEYHEKQKLVNAGLSEDAKADLQDIITTKTTLVVRSSKSW
ncbi:MAG: hypothetical protein ABJA76_06295 [Mucilaginibacter sp.]